MKKTILILLVLLSLLFLSIRYVGQPLGQALGAKERAGLKVISSPTSAVILDGKEVGKTPFESDQLSSGDYQVELRAKRGSWRGKVTLNDGTVSVINREITAEPIFSSGEVLTLERGSGVLITADPAGSQLEIDNKDYGETPILISELPAGEHTFTISHQTYLKRNIQALLPAGMRLQLNVSLALTESESNMTEKTQPMAETSLVKQLVVKETPGGFLRVRSRPSIQSAEITRISTGEVVTEISKLPGWYKIRTTAGFEGYVSASYVFPKP